MIIVAIMKQEHRFLQEWLDYHVSIGVSKFILFQNDEPQNGYKFNVPKNIIVDVIPFHNKYNGMPTQIEAYNTACKMCMGEVVAFIDLDEFITISPKFAKTLPHKTSLIDEAYNACQFEALAVSWLNMSAGNHINRPKMGVLEAYTNKSPKIRDVFNFKTIMLVKEGVKWETTPHRPSHNYGLFDTNGNEVKEVQTDDLYDKIYIRHYMTKSWQDWVDKLKRGNFTKGLRTVNTFFEYNPQLNHLKEALIDCYKRQNKKNKGRD